MHRDLGSAKGPGEETVSALARRCSSTHRGGDSQGTGEEMWQYSRGPGEETVRALARRGGSTHGDLGRRQSGHWPGEVAVCTGTWGGDSETWHWPGEVAVRTGTWGGNSQYAQGPGEETVSTHRDLGVILYRFNTHKFHFWKHFCG